MKKAVLHFLFLYQFSTCIFAFPYLLYLTLRVILPKLLRAAYLRGGTAQIIRCLFSPFAFYLCLSALICGCFSSVSYASSPPANNVHFCEVIDYEAMRARDSIYAATKQALNLNVGEPRTVRMIYFLPNDRPFQQAVVDSMKVKMRQVQTFYADQMEAHGYGRKTFRFETDAQGDPVVHRLDGQHPNQYYLDGGSYWQESRQKFDFRANNVYWTVWDNGTGGVSPGLRGVGGGGRDGGFANVSAHFDWRLVAHELGHAFGLEHDFRDDAYIMSYGDLERGRLSECSAGFLAVHPYFDLDIPVEETPGPTIELISSPGYPTGSTSVSIQLKVSDADGLHQVILFFDGQFRYVGGWYQVKACRGLTGERDAIVEFDYDGVIPTDGSTGLSDPLIHKIYVEAVDSFGNVGGTRFTLFDVSNQHNLIATFEGHTDDITSVVFSPDGTMLASGSDDGTIKLWDVATKTNIATLEGHTQSVTSVSFSPDGTILASGSRDNNRPLKLWDVATKTNIATLGEHMGAVESVVFSPNGTALAAVSGQWVKLWDVTTRTNIATLKGHTGRVHSVSFSPDGTMLASGSGDNMVKLWDVATRTEIATFRHAFVNTVAFSPDGTMLASGAGDSAVKLWDVATRTNIATLYGLVGRVTSVVFSPDGTTLASGTENGTVDLWNIASMSKLTTHVGDTSPVRSVVFSPDGTTLASASGDGTVFLWDTSEMLRPRPYEMVKVSGDNQQGTSGAELTRPLVVELRDQYDNPLPDAQVMFTVTAGNGKLNGKFTAENIMTDTNGRAQSTLTLGPNPGTNTVEVSGIGLVPVTFNAVGVATSGVPIMGRDYQTWHLPDGAIVRLGKGSIKRNERAIAFSPDGTILALASGIGIWLYDVATSRELALITGVVEANSVAFSPDRTILASGAESGRVKLWDVATQRNIATFRGHTHWVRSVVFSPDGTMLASGSWDGTIKLWDVETRTNIATLEGHRSVVRSVAFSPNGTILASGEGGWDEDGIVNLWDVETRTNIATLKGHTGRVYSVSFAPDGTMLASGSRDGTIKLWGVAQRAEVATLRGDDAVHSVSFSPDGTTLASASGRGAVKSTVNLWDVATRTTIATFNWYRGNIESVSFSPDGTTLATVSDTGIILLWDIARQTIATYEGHSGGVHSVSFSPDGTILASGEYSSVKLWDIATRTNIATFEADIRKAEWHVGEIASVSFSPDGTLLASASDFGTVKLWDIATRTEVASFFSTGRGASVLFSPDGTTLASGSLNDGVLLWDVTTRTDIATLEYPGKTNSMAFSPDGKMLALGKGLNWDAQGTITLWNVATQRNIATLGESLGVYSMSFSPDGATLASGLQDGTVKLWDIATRTNIATLKGWGTVHSVSFSPDGAILASGSWYAVKLWDVVTRTNIATLEGHNSVPSVSFSPDGTTLSSGLGNGTILLWDMSPYVTPQTPAPASTPDFDGDGIVGIPDFLLFVDQFGFRRSDGGYDARFDLDGNGVIGISDFLIFIDNFGKKVS